MRPATYLRWVREEIQYARSCLRGYVVLTGTDGRPLPSLRGHSAVALARYHRSLERLRSHLSERAGWWQQDERGAA